MAKHSGPASVAAKTLNQPPAGTKDNGKVRIGYGSPSLPPGRIRVDPVRQSKPIRN